MSRNLHTDVRDGEGFLKLVTRETGVAADMKQGTKVRPLSLPISNTTNVLQSPQRCGNRGGSGHIGRGLFNPGDSP